MMQIDSQEKSYTNKDKIPWYKLSPGFWIRYPSYMDFKFVRCSILMNNLCPSPLCFRLHINVKYWFHEGLSFGPAMKENLHLGEVQ